VVAVSNEVGSGVVPADPGTRLYRDLMGRVNATIARRSETVLWCVAGRTVAL
jgi:adenosylcobinamide kinase / adenosylcobinamide-phosphate guanylyltransferase